MRLHYAGIFALVIGISILVGAQHSTLAAAPENLGTYEDRIAVEDVMARYVWTVDSLDADGYVAVFTEDAVIDSKHQQGTRTDPQDRHRSHQAPR